MSRPVRIAWQAVRHPVGLNAISLYAVQFATFIIPLVTLPYLSRHLGTAAFGRVVFAQGFAVLLGLVIDFGLEYSASRTAAAERTDARALGLLAARVAGARGLLIAASALLAAVLVLAITPMRRHPDLFALAWIAAVANGMSPGWFFVGMERLRLVSAIQLAVRVLGAVFVFALVRDAGDAWVVLALFAATSASASLIMSGIMYLRIPVTRPRLDTARALLREARTLFVGTTAIALYSSVTVVLLGIVAPAAQVARYGAADRIVRAALQLLGPVTLAVFPRLAYLHANGARERARRLAWVTMAVLGSFGLLTAAGLVALAGPIVRVVYGEDFGGAAGVLRILAVLLPILALAQTLAGGWMMAVHLDSSIVRAVVRAAVTIFVVGLPLGALFGATGMAVAVIVSELVALGGCVAAVRRHDATVELPLFSREAMLVRG